MLSALFVGTQLSALDIAAVGFVIVAVALPALAKWHPLHEETGPR
jgi:hypothetical protein